MEATVSEGGSEQWICVCYTFHQPILVSASQAADIWSSAVLRGPTGWMNERMNKLWCDEGKKDGPDKRMQEWWDSQRKEQIE